MHLKFQDYVSTDKGFACERLPYYEAAKYHDSLYAHDRAYSWVVSGSSRTHSVSVCNTHILHVLTEGSHMEGCGKSCSHDLADTLRVCGSSKTSSITHVNILACTSLVLAVHIMKVFVCGP